MIKSEFEPSKPYTYVRYGRMSDPGQNPRSPDQQFDTIGAELCRRGYPWKYLGREYRDDGISGRYQSKRPGYQQMLQDIRTGAIEPDLILVDTIERFGRMTELDEVQRKLFNQHGVLVLSADTGFADPSSEAGRAMRWMKNYQATAEGRTMAHNVV